MKLNFSVPVDLFAVKRAIRDLAGELTPPSSWRLTDTSVGEATHHLTVSEVQGPDAVKAAEFSLIPCSSGETALEANIVYHSLETAVTDLIKALGGEPAQGQGQVASKPYGPTEKVTGVAEQARKIKDAEPTKSLQAVALDIGITPDAIRYAYRAMGWTWERADRVRAKR